MVKYGCKSNLLKIIYLKYRYIECYSQHQLEESEHVDFGAQKIAARPMEEAIERILGNKRHRRGQFKTKKAASFAHRGAMLGKGLATRTD